MHGLDFIGVGSEARPRGEPADDGHEEVPRATPCIIETSEHFDSIRGNTDFFLGFAKRPGNPILSVFQLATWEGHLSWMTSQRCGPLRKQNTKIGFLPPEADQYARMPEVIGNGFAWEEKGLSPVQRAQPLLELIDVEGKRKGGI